MYLLQFPIAPLHIYNLTRTANRRQPRQSHQSAPNSARLEPNVPQHIATINHV
ncbi:uncharacterized protein CELE_C54E10.7 [Caenorhabditis elegans]|uniref:Uncharacterized protein n=1 Tax=Caenorhabditis elegans TaxID=6239 RepID=D5MCU3_CAEEL|nr:Uncharacterized protein CELE_C54E10.7 [Caenorhabditis elegans]CBL43427.1 Uncharacterized protein CELE_C54E10.7 [Caenorhabditis elegans]|eukprot:NP_001256827.1 Uncharacterized protein CELE_C54E10.7 [Caenorhabditis elegans]